MSRARQSMYPGPVAPSYWSILDQCSQSLHASCSNLSSATTTLHHGTYDFPRLAQVVNSRRAFDTVTETEIKLAQKDLVDEIQPQISELIDRAENGLELMKKRERVLRTRLEKRTALTIPQNRPSTVPDVEALQIQLDQLRKTKENLGQKVETLEQQLTEANKARGTFGRSAGGGMAAAR